MQRRQKVEGRGPVLTSPSRQDTNFRGICIQTKNYTLPLKGKVWKENMKYDKKLNLKLSTNLGSDQWIVSWVLERSQWGGQGDSDSWMSPGTKAEECGENLPAPHCVYHPLRDALGLGRGQLGLQWCPAEISQLELYLLAWPLLFMGLRNLSGVMPSIYKLME